MNSSINFLGGRKSQQATLTISQDEQLTTAAMARIYAPLKQNPKHHSFLSVRMQVDPETAKHWLANHNTRNRRVKQYVWHSYAADILAGRWRPEYCKMPIAFDINGVLIDGQHRLIAIVHAQTTVEALVEFGQKTEARDFIDIGCSRSASDLASLDGIKNSVSCCALAGMLLVHRAVGIDKLHDARYRPSRSACKELVVNEPRIQEVAAHASMWGKVCAPSVMMFCYYVFSEQDIVKADRFFSELIDLANLGEDNPVRFLAKRLQVNKTAKAKLPVREIMALFFKAWVYYRDGVPMKSLRWNNSGPKPEEFPCIDRS